MQDFPLLTHIAMIWVSALIAGYICTRLKQPTIAGYIVAGIVIGPNGLNLIARSEEIAVLAEFGVALLLFALGAEVSLKQILTSPPRLILCGVLQITLTTLAGWFAAAVSGLTETAQAGFLFGFICALSSTALVTKVLMERGETDSAHGRLTVPVLIMQDLSLLPVMSILPALTARSGPLITDVVLPVVKAVLLIPLVLVAATYVIPALLSWVVKANSRELFLLTTVSLCLGIALVGNQLGLSVALGAFLAGIMVSESVYGQHALAEIVPLKELLSTLFFVSVGLLLDPRFIAAHVAEVALFVFLLMAGKIVLATLSAAAATRSLRTALICGVGLGQVGEFSFVLAAMGLEMGIISADLYSEFFSASVVTLIASPLIINSAPRLFALLAGGDGRGDDCAGGLAEPHAVEHVVICGFGRIGRNLGVALRQHGIPLVVIEISPGIREELDKHGIAHVLGDAVSRNTLLRAGVSRAAAIAITVPDPVAAVSIIAIARKLKPDIKVIARAHRSEDIEPFRAAGANAVVQPEFEASIEITRMVLLSLNRSNPDIQRALSDIRIQRYQIFKPDIAEPSLMSLLGFPSEEHSGLWFHVAGNGFAGSTIGELNVKRKTGASILAVKRQDALIAHPEADCAIRPGDELYVVGRPADLSCFEKTYSFARFCPTTEATSSEMSPGEAGD